VFWIQHLRKNTWSLSYCNRSRQLEGGTHSQKEVVRALIPPLISGSAVGSRQDGGRGMEPGSHQTNNITGLVASRF